MDVKTQWNSTMELGEQAYRLHELPRKWLKNPNQCHYRTLFTTQDEWTIVKYIMDFLRQFRYYTLWMSKMRTVTLHQVITVFNDMIEHIDGVMRALPKNKTQKKENLHLAVKFACQKVSKYYAQVTPSSGTLLNAAHILDTFQNLRLFRKWDKRTDIDPEDGTSYTIQYKEAFLKNVENEYYSKHRRLPIIKPKSISCNTLFCSSMASRSGSSSNDPYDLSSCDEEY